MNATTHDVSILYAAIDAGHNDALLALADALEELGNPLASAMRSIALSAERPRLATLTSDSGWVIFGGRCSDGWTPYNGVGQQIYCRLPGFEARRQIHSDEMVFPSLFHVALKGGGIVYSTRHDAYLALATALAALED